MTQLQWSEALVLGLDFMDDTHREFVGLLAACDAAQDSDLALAWDSLIGHTALALHLRSCGFDPARATEAA